MRFRRALRDWTFTLLATLFTLVMLLPLIEMGLASIKTLDQVFSIPHSLWPEEVYLGTYLRDLWQTVPLMPRYILNSLLISTGVTLIALGLTIPASYSISRYRFPGRKQLLFLVLAINLLSPVIMLVPLFRTMRFFGLLNTYWAMIVPGAAFLMPFAVWMLAAYFDSIPKALEEAARIDGANQFQNLRHVVLPLIVPGLVSVSIYTFIVSWGQQFIFAITFNTNPRLNPIPQGLYEYFGQNLVRWNELMAASLISIVPVMILFLFLQRYLIQGLTAGAVKG